MAAPHRIVLIRFRSGLPLEEVKRVALERLPEFQALGGLTQKYYLHDPETGEIGGLYLWESAEALSEFQASALRATIAEAYQVQAPPRIESYEVLATLRES